MIQWLEIYLAFALAGGLATYLTVVRTVKADMEEITDKKSEWMKRPVLYFNMWMLLSIFTAPFLLLILLRGDISEFKNAMLIRWLESAGHND